MAGSTGLMNYAVNYDVDQNAMPSVVYLTAKCTDLTGQTGTTGLTIFIQVCYRFQSLAFTLFNFR